MKKEVYVSMVISTPMTIEIPDYLEENELPTYVYDNYIDWEHLDEWNVDDFTAIEDD